MALPTTDSPPGGRFRPQPWPWRRRTRRIGADAAFAKAMARSEFGRFYSDENAQREVARSLARAKAASATLNTSVDVSRAPARKQAVAKRKVELWREPRVRERRTELADARARLLSAARRRSTPDEP
jgi:hypothetical protein